MAFLDDLKGALNAGWEFFYSMPNLYPLKYRNSAGPDAEGKGGVGGEIAEYRDSNDQVIVRIDDRGIVGKVQGGTVGAIEIGAWQAAFVTSYLEPLGALECDGRLLEQADYALLFAAIGTGYNTGGEGAGQFRLPNADGRAFIGPDGGYAGGMYPGAADFDVAAHAHAQVAHPHVIASHTHPANHDHDTTDHAHDILTNQFQHSHDGETAPATDGLTNSFETGDAITGSAQQYALKPHIHNISDSLSGGTAATQSGGADNTSGPMAVGTANPKTDTDANTAALTTASDGATTTGTGGAITDQPLLQPSLVVRAIIWTGKGM